MKKEPNWIHKKLIFYIHYDQIEQHGGSFKIRDVSSLESALDRPKNKFHYDKSADIFDLASSYGFGLCMNHPFVDGNKRVSFQAMYVFLRLNGFEISATEEDVVIKMLLLAEGKLTEKELSQWLRLNAQPL